MHLDLSCAQMFTQSGLHLLVRGIGLLQKELLYVLNISKISISYVVKDGL